MVKWIILAIFIISALYIHRRGKVRHSFYRQFFDHSTVLAPINFLMYMFSKVPNQPYIDTQYFKDLKAKQVIKIPYAIFYLSFMTLFYYTF
mgnify:CR=1 FL=1